MTELQQRIIGVWEAIESGEEDASTEYLFALVIDSFELQGIDIDESDVSNALNAQADKK